MSRSPGSQGALIRRLFSFLAGGVRGPSLLIWAFFACGLLLYEALHLPASHRERVGTVFGASSSPRVPCVGTAPRYCQLRARRLRSAGSLLKLKEVKYMSNEMRVCKACRFWVAPSRSVEVTSAAPKLRADRVRSKSAMCSKNMTYTQGGSPACTSFKEAA